ncbi:MAG: hypothetical protein K2M44_06315 [Clostridia bacterium]|nr:hypothetical protein [Clostridia bacterium]
MKEIFRSLKLHKYLSFIASCLLIFAFAGVARRYAFDFIYKSDNMAQIGAPWLNVTAFISAMTVVGAVLGVAFAALALKRKKATHALITVAYAFAGMLCALSLFFTPYTMQLLLPAHNLQNLAAINLFLLSLFCIIDVALLTFSAATHIVLALRQDAPYIFAFAIFSVIASAAVAVLCGMLGGSFRVFVGVVAALLIAINVVHALIGADSAPVGDALQCNKGRLISVTALFFILLISVVAAVGTYTAQLIAL